MVQSNSPTKAQLVEALKSTGAESVDKLRALPESAFEAGC